MFQINSPTSMSVAAGEPILLELQLADWSGVVQPLAATNRSFVLSLYQPTTPLVYSTGTPMTDGTGDFVRWTLDGSYSESLRGKTGILFELSERLDNGRDRLMTGTLSVDSSAPRVDDDDDAPPARFISRIKRQFDPIAHGLTPSYTFSYEVYTSFVAPVVLSLTGPLTYAANTAAGTLVANIAGVPSGVTPTLTPNDGRLIVAGDANNGWKVVTGMSASSAGTFTLAVAASGATGASASVTVTAPAAVEGASATSFALAPTVHYHINDPSTVLTMLGGTASFTCSAPVNSSTITVDAGGTGAAIVKGMVLSIGGYGFPAYLRVTDIGSYTQAGGGTIYTSEAAYTAVPAGTAGTATGTNVVVGVSDLQSKSPLVNTDGFGPLLITDAFGRKALVFHPAGSPANYGCSLIGRGLTIPRTTTMTWLAVQRQPNTYSPAGGGNSIVTVANQMVLGVQAGSVSGVSGIANNPPTPLPFHSNDYDSMGSGPGGMAASDRRKLLVGCNLDVIGISGVQPSSGNPRFRYAYNNWSANHTSVINNYGYDQTQFVLGSNQSGGLPSYIGIVYELVGYCDGQITDANQTAAFDAARDAMLNNFNVKPYTDRVICIGDSRMFNNARNGRSIGALLSDPGSSLALPSTTQVIDMAVGGSSINHFGSAFNDPIGGFSTDMMMGGGHDTVMFLDGVNPMTNNSTAIWPGTSADQGGLTNAGTNARADEVYDGAAALSATITGYSSNQTLTVTSIASGSGPILIDQVIAGVGARVTSRPSGGGTGNYGLDSNLTLGSSSAPVTINLVWTSQRSATQQLVTRGFKVVVAVDLHRSTDTVRERLANYQRNMAGAITGGTNKVFVADLPNITVSGQKVMSDDAVSQGPYLIDGVHPTDLGNTVIIGGGDTPALGMRSVLMTAIGA